MDAVVLKQVKNLEKTMGISDVNNKFAISAKNILANFSDYTTVGGGTLELSAYRRTAIGPFTGQESSGTSLRDFFEYNGFLWSFTINNTNMLAQVYKINKDTYEVLNIYNATSAYLSAQYLYSWYVDKVNGYLYVFGYYNGSGSTRLCKFNLNTGTMVYEKNFGTSGSNIVDNSYFDELTQSLYVVYVSSATVLKVTKANLSDGSGIEGVTNVTITSFTSNSRPVYYRKADGKLRVLLTSTSNGGGSLIYNLTDSLIDMNTNTSYLPNTYYGTSFRLIDGNTLYLQIQNTSSEYSFLSVPIESIPTSGTLPLTTLANFGTSIYLNTISNYTNMQDNKYNFAKKFGTDWYFRRSDNSIVKFSTTTNTFDTSNLFLNANLHQGVQIGYESLIIDVENKKVWSRGYQYDVDYTKQPYSLQTTGETLAVFYSTVYQQTNSTSQWTPPKLTLIVDGVKISRNVMIDDPVIISAKTGLAVQNDAQFNAVWGVK